MVWFRWEAIVLVTFKVNIMHYFKFNITVVTKSWYSELESEFYSLPYFIYLEEVEGSCKWFMSSAISTNVAGSFTASYMIYLVSQVEPSE